jgi:hypothetical protein
MPHYRTSYFCSPNSQVTASLGIIMLDTDFVRPLGDAGNPASWPFPVHIQRVPGATAKAVVMGNYREIDAFLEVGNLLIKRGARAIITTCGFLVRHQQQLAGSLTVPVETSPLMHFERLQKNLGALGEVAILTIDALALNKQIRQAAGIPPGTLIFSLPRESHFVSAILDGLLPLDPIRAEAEWVAKARECLQTHPRIACWLFECANMPPYAAAVSRATGLPVFDTLTMGRELLTRATAL